MHKLILGLSWINGRFKVVALHKGTVTGQWECPQLVGVADDLKPILLEAVQQTHYTGFLAALVLAHPQLALQLVEAPPVEGRDLAAFLERRAQQVKPFDEPAAWSYQGALPTKSAHGILLYTFPQTILQDLVRSCREINLHLVKLFPTTALLQSQLAHLPLKPGETTLLAAETEGSTALLIGRKSGEIFLGRFLGATWQTDLEHTIAEVKRTTLFTKQRFNTNVDGIWLLGHGAQDHVAYLQRTLDLPVQVCPEPVGPFFWIQEALALPPAASANLITKEMQKAPQRRILFRVTSALVALLMACCVAVTAYVETLLQKRTRERVRLEPKRQELLLEKQQLNLLQADRARQQVFTDFLDKTIPPVAGWFLGYLANLPEKLVVTDFRLGRLEPQEGLWQLRLAGLVQPAEGQPVQTAMTENLEVLESRLQSGPYHLTITNSTLRALRGGKSAASASSSSSSLLRSLSATTDNAFFIEGLMREGATDPKKPPRVALAKGTTP